MRTSSKLKGRFTELIDENNFENKAAAAKQLGITYVTFSKIYNYGIIPKVAVLIKLSDYFDISISYLLAWSDDDEYFIKSKERQTFAQRLTQLMKEFRIASNYELGEKVHIHRNVIGQWINKGFLPELENLEILSDYFDVSLDYLLGRTDDRD